MKRPDFPIPWKDALEGSKLAIENAERLANDAYMLRQNDKLASAFCLGLIGWEEIGKAVLLYKHWKERRDVDEKHWNKILLDHKPKLVAYDENLDILYPRDPRLVPKTLEEMLKSLNRVAKERGKRYDLAKQAAFYVNWAGEWQSPCKLGKELFDFPFHPYQIENVLLAAQHLKTLVQTK